MPTQPLTAVQVATILGKSVRTVQRMAEQGRLPVIHKLPGDTGAYLFDPDTIHEHVA